MHDLSVALGADFPVITDASLQPTDPNCSDLPIVNRRSGARVAPLPNQFGATLRSSFSDEGFILSSKRVRAVFEQSKAEALRFSTPNRKKTIAQESCQQRIARGT